MIFRNWFSTFEDTLASPHMTFRRLLRFSTLCVLFMNALHGQTTFWTEAFENGCAFGCLANAYVGPNGAWTVTTTGANGTCPNQFYVSCAENGNAAGACGTGCGTDESLHIANQSCSPWAPAFCPTGDCGAAYDAGSACSGLGCTFGLCTCGATGLEAVSNRTARSPVINATGYTSVSVSFVYMENGQAASDNADFEYFDGAVWTTVALGKTAVCGGGQGQWTTITIPLPASINNNPNLRIGFRWTNNGDGVGTDPSFAVDDVVISGTAPLPVNLVGFDANCEAGLVHLNWITSSEQNNAYFLVEKSTDASDWFEAGRVQGNGNSNVEHQYHFTDSEISSLVYYRLKQVDFDGTVHEYYPISVSCQNTADEIIIHPNPANGIFYLTAGEGVKMETITIINANGQIVIPPMWIHQEDSQRVELDANQLLSGMYIVQVKVGNSIVNKRLIVVHD